MKITKDNIELSIFSVSLQSFLEESHPHLKNDLQFIKQRGDFASETFERMRFSGESIEQAIKKANDVLFLGLHFSVYDTIKVILWEEFEGLIPDYAFNDTALGLYHKLKYISEKYDTTDDFEQSDKYKEFYVELTGAILIYFNEHGI